LGKALPKATFAQKTETKFDESDKNAKIRSTDGEERQQGFARLTPTSVKNRFRRADF
jgi:hypothetical protein